MRGPAPPRQPIGLHLARPARGISRAFDGRLRHGLSESDTATFEELLDRLGRNVAGDDAASQFAGVLE